MLIDFFLSESSALPRPPPPLLYHLAVVITSADSAHLRFAIEKRRFPTSVTCYDITAVKLPEVGRVPKNCTQVKVKVLLEIFTQVKVIV